jgi:hypothetical protein
VTSRISHTTIDSQNAYQQSLSLGATEVADHRRPDGSGWVTLADPEGNELCVFRGDSEFTDAVRPLDHLIGAAPLVCSTISSTSSSELDLG